MNKTNENDTTLILTRRDLAVLKDDFAHIKAINYGRELYAFDKLNNLLFGEENA